MSWGGLIAESLPFAFKAISGLATAYGISRIADAFVGSGAQTALSRTLSPSQSTTDVIKQAEAVAQQQQTIAGTNNPQNGAIAGLPDEGGQIGKLIAALGGLGLGAGALGAVALTRRGGRKARGRRGGGRGRRRATRRPSRRSYRRRSRGGRRF